MEILFEPTAICGMELKNRFVRSATHDGCASDRGEVTEDTLRLYTGLARGGAGLIVSGYAYVQRSGQNYLHQAAADRDDLIPGMKRLTAEVHRYGARIVLQIVHCGRNSRAVRKRGEVPLAPSFVGDSLASPESHREMTSGEIEGLVEAFGLAAVRAREAGFDGVQLHAAHSYLFSQFLSPHSNRRTDRWGGNLENRMLFHRQVIASIRKAAGNDFPLLIKLGVCDTVEGGLTLDEGCTVARALALPGSDFPGVDAIEVSEGLEDRPANHIKKGIGAGQGEGYYGAWAKRVRASAGVPVLLVGGLRSYAAAESALREGDADLVSMCRPFIREPDLVNRWQRGNRDPAACISCNLCLKKIGRDELLECVQNANALPRAGKGC